MKTHDLDFVKEMLPILYVEQEFFRCFRSVDWTTLKGNVYHLYQYRVIQDSPRAESYLGDFTLTADTENGSQLADTVIVNKMNILSFRRRQETYVRHGLSLGIRLGFSTGQFAPNIHNGLLRSIRTSRVVPVDLNAFICWNDKILSNFARLVGNERLSCIYFDRYVEMRSSMNNIF